MISVVLTVCLVAAPSTCKDVRIPILEIEAKTVTPFGCALNGQKSAMKWNRDHPKWKIARYKCVDEDKKDIEI